MRTGTAQFGVVAPWFDITNSYQRHWIRTHRWKNPECFSEHPPALFPALADLDALPGHDVVRPRTARDRRLELNAPIGL
jgi:hypothetical protein